jgi:hypothetical protein
MNFPYWKLRIYNQAKLSDILQVFEQDDIMEVPQAIKGFDNTDFCEVISIDHNKCKI